MRNNEQTLVSRRTVASAGALAALLTASTATGASSLYAGVDGDAELLDLGRRWIALCDQHDDAYTATVGWPDDDARHKDVDRATDLLFKEEMAVFDAISAIKARTLRGLAVKALVLARAHDCVGRDVVSMQAALDGAPDLESTAALSLALDIVRLSA